MNMLQLSHAFNGKKFSVPVLDNKMIHKELSKFSNFLGI